jgi:hypothetical protein
MTRTICEIVSGLLLFPTSGVVLRSETRGVGKILVFNTYGVQCDTQRIGNGKNGDNQIQ